MRFDLALGDGCAAVVGVDAVAPLAPIIDSMYGTLFATTTRNFIMHAAISTAYAELRKVRREAHRQGAAAERVVRREHWGR